MTPTLLATQQSLTLVDLAGAGMVLATFTAGLVVIGGLLELAGVDVQNRILRAVFR
jgi:hypothetical protein